MSDASAGAGAGAAAVVGPELEAPRPSTGPDFSDAITFAFGDERAGVFGTARAGIADGLGSGLAILFAGGETIAARAEGGVALRADATAAGGSGPSAAPPAAAGPSGPSAWSAVDAGGVTTTVDEPLERWTVRFDAGADGGFELEFVAIAAPVEMRGGGMTGYEQLCRVRGTVRVGASRVGVECLGQRGHQWGTPDWKRLALVRTVGAWLAEDAAVFLSAFRAAKAKDHARDAIDAVVLEGPDLDVVEIEEPLISSAYDEDGRQRRIGWELWPAAEDGYARRGAGELVCGTSLDLGRLRLDSAFFRFRMDGRAGVGRYDVLRRA